MPRVTVRPRAWREIDRQVEYLQDQAGAELAERFLDGVLQTFDQLAQMPQLGDPCNFRRAALKRLRRWPVQGFERWLVFYFPRRDGIEVVHLIHGARDIGSILGP
jgi:toxin ParE1/3/4